ncbi:MAG: hypothetical protein AAB288_11520, partial [Acidobacteriota bacterium]
SLAVSSIVKWRVVASGTLLGMFFIPSAFGAIVNELFVTRLGNLVSMWATINSIWRGLFGLFDRQIETIRDRRLGEIVLSDPPLWASWLVIAVVCALCIWLLSLRVRAYEVIK